MKIYLIIISLTLNFQALGQHNWNEIVKDYDIICLGEETHGIETYYKEKHKLIKIIDSLSKTTSILLIESPLVNSVISKLRKQKSNYHYHHTNTESNVAYFSKFNTLGFDFQEDCRFTEFSKYLIEEEYVNRFDPDLQAMDSLLSLCIIGANYQKDVFTNQELQKFLISIDNLTRKVTPKLNTESEKYLLELCFNNRIYLGEYLNIPTSQRYKYRIKFRDQKMADNLKTLIEQYKDFKKIIWAANLHIGKNGVMGKKWRREGIMSSVEYLSEEQEVYSIAIKSKVKKSDIVFYDKTIYLSKIKTVDEKYLKLNCK